MAHMALLFSALVHDVDHSGVSNRQLVIESDPLAITYNDQSVAENRSLAVAFSLFMQDRYKELRYGIFCHRPTQSFGNKDPYPKHTFAYFRSLVIQIVLCTGVYDFLLYTYCIL